MYGQQVRHRTGMSHSHSPIPNQTLGSQRNHGIPQSPGPTHMSNHPPVTPFPPYRGPFGSISPSPFTSPFARLATPFKSYYSRRFAGHSQPYGHSNSSSAFGGHSLEDQLDFKAGMFAYACGLFIALFLFWFSATVNSSVLSFLFCCLSLIVAVGCLWGAATDVYTWVLIPQMNKLREQIQSFSLSQYLPFLVAPQAPIGVINTPPRRRRGPPGGGIGHGHGSPTRIGGPSRTMGDHRVVGPAAAGGTTTGSGGAHTRHHEAYLRPAHDTFISPTRGRNDVIIKDPFGLQQRQDGTATAGGSGGQPDEEQHQQRSWLGSFNTLLWGDQQNRRSQSSAAAATASSSTHRQQNGQQFGGPPHSNVTMGRGGRAAAVDGRGGVVDHHPHGTPIGSAFDVAFSPIPSKTNNMISPYGASGFGGVGMGGGGASKMFSPMSLDSARVNTSMTSNFSFIGIGGGDDAAQPIGGGGGYSASAPLSPRHRVDSRYPYSQSMNATGYYHETDRILQPTMRGRNEQTSSYHARYDGSVGMSGTGSGAQLYGGSYRHPAEHEKKRASLAEHVESSVELYRALNIDDSMHNWAEQMRWWLMNKVIKTRVEDWKVNDVNVNELFQFMCDKFPEHQQQLSNFQSPAKRGEFFLANVEQMNQMAHHLNAPQILEIIQKRQYIVNAMKKICGSSSSRYLDYLEERLDFLSSNSNPSDLKWNQGGKDWDGKVLPTDCQLLMSMFGQFMDDFLCPAVEFSGKYLVKCDQFPHEDEMDEMVRKNCSGFEDVAIVEVGHHVFEKRNERIMGPYYFVVFDKVKYRTADDQARYNKRGHRGVGSSGSTSRRSSSTSRKYAAWYPQPGASNMFHALTLFAFFLHTYMDDSLSSRSLRDHEMFVDCVKRRFK